jgi:N-acetylated-alpha-linked acidic dipeptidase
MRSILPSILIAAVLAFSSCRSGVDSPLDPHAVDQLVSRNQIADFHHRCASSPHPAGSSENQVVGNQISEALRDMGLRTWVDDGKASLYHSSRVSLSLTAPEDVVFDLHESVLPEDSYTAVAARFPPYLAYSANGEVEGDVVYANYGADEDYQELLRNGIDPSGKIALVRAQGICRSAKVQIAERHRVLALLIYPELRDQGFLKPRYPSGPTIHPSTIQRGTLLKYYLMPGDTTGLPGGKTLPRIPAVAISEIVAERILRVISGPSAPASWQGWLMKTPYHLGPGPARVRAEVDGRLEPGRIRNILAEVPGRIPDSAYLIIGCHYDAWVYGANDPCSGTAVVLETARVLSTLSKSGWRPRRKLLFAFWDGEEPGMFGSTRWVANHTDTLKNEVFLYINVDTAVRGHAFVAFATPGYGHALDRALKAVTDPVNGKQISEVAMQTRLPGFSADSAAFMGLAGTPVVEPGFGLYYGVYHSVLDNLRWYERFQDPGHLYAATLCKILLLYASDLSQSLLVPFRFSELSHYLKSQADESREPDPDLQSELQRFAEAAGNWDRVAKDLPKTDPTRMRAADRLLLQAIYSFQDRSSPFASRNLLVQPSPQEGCSGQTSQPTDSLSVALRNAGELLRRAERLLRTEN